MAEENIPEEVAAVTAKIQNRIENFHEKEVRALRGLGKYRLPPAIIHKAFEANTSFYVK